MAAFLQALGLVGSMVHSRSLIDSTVLSSKMEHVGRRAALLALPGAMLAAPHGATAADNFILLNPLDNEFLKLRLTQAQLDDLTRQFGAANHKYSDDDRTMVFQLLGFSFKPTVKLLERMIKPMGVMYDIEGADRAKGMDIAAQFGEQVRSRPSCFARCQRDAVADASEAFVCAQVLVLEERTRSRAELEEQLETLKTLSGLIDAFLRVAATKYAVPAVPQMRGGQVL